MGLKHTSRYCPRCKNNVMASGTTTNHVLHVFLTACTAGLWGIVWILFALQRSGNYRCIECGSPVQAIKT